ncbi:cytochrome b [Erwinia sp. QL-Z3]|uniref:cytochrome b n=1 Tax=Erwinia sp. QL-Z3 TaxID=2547962 RepID=UPI001070B5C5|nr:cytochrome b [Erwinia sp. QL-Z3]QBR51036.1 cytochrome b [Erwinia sp. QL-Z3]
MHQTSAPVHYDRLTIALHWLTALDVIFLFASYQVWSRLEKGTPLRHDLQSLHISFGLLLALLMVVRIVWRISKGRRLPPASPSRAAHVGAKSVHGLLYLLLIAQVVLGFLFRWAQGEPFAFFNFGDLSDLVYIESSLRKLLGSLHYYNAWLIIVLAGGHAVVALLHHYALRDGTLKRMIPKLK